MTATVAVAQLNMELLSQVQYNDTGLNDIWGWADPETGIEYAIVGLQQGVSIVSLEDPENAEEVVRIPGQFSTWRDMKTWGNFAYITTDQGGTTEGVTVIDMSQLPEAAPYYHWTPDLPGLGTLETCHNIYIDEFGYAYLAGCNMNNGGMVILNVDTETGEPEFVGPAPAIYSHDVYVVNNHMYASEIYVGDMTIYDVSDKENIQALGATGTPFSFTHNIWVNEDETVAFTTDEVADAPVAAYDITDFSEIEELDQYRPVGTVGLGVIPHNVHVWDNYLLISYYTDGGRVVDASRADNLIEVGNYDTWLGGDGGFSGAWGLYPFLPSQTVLVTDINNGLYVLQPDFKRACWLEGIVRDSVTQAPVNGATVIIDSEQPNYGESDPFGAYATGQVLAGTFEVTFEKAGYQSKTLEVNLDNGVLTELDVDLVPLQQYSIAGQAVRNPDGQPVPGAFVQAYNETFSFNTVADVNGNFTFNNITEGTYEIVAGSWGYLHGVLEAVDLSNSAEVTIALETGYQDDFLFDFDWLTSATSPSGQWELGLPVGTDYQGTQSHPGMDAPDDLGFSCYSTGNGGGGAGNDDVDNGSVVLRSPVMDLSNYDIPMLSLSYWFFNSGGQAGSIPNDELVISITNGTEEVEIATITQSLSLWRKVQQVNLADLIGLTDEMQLVITASDDQAQGHLVEAGIDKVLIEEMGMPSNTEALSAAVAMQAFPNPAKAAFTVTYEVPQTAAQVDLVLYNALGQEVEHQQLDATNGQFRCGEKLNAGIYFAHLMVDGTTMKTLRLVKQ
jgi:choice-of-anchor B domain-containing protein